MKYAVGIITLLTFSLFFLNKESHTLQAAPASKGGIKWMDFDEAQAKMKVEPKKVFVDIYTTWCGWCKVMDKKTFANKYVIEYMNENFYCIKYNAETKSEIEFMGKKYAYNQKYKANDLAIELMKGQLSFPTSIFFDENFVNGQPIPGYLDVAKMEMTAKYIGENNHKKMPWNKYQEEFKASWK
jgi:thioredoxin-related protein